MQSPKVIYEDGDVLVVDKPAGLMVHSDGRSSQRTLADWILAKYPELKDVGEGLRIKDQGLGDKVIYRPGIVHRLDRDTSGVMIVAKTQKAHAFLKKQFQDRLAKKSYLAVVWGKFPEDNGVIDKPIGKSASDFRLRSAEYGARGELREAETHWQVVERFGDRALLRVLPKTGRTHQIRVHMKAIGHPVVCDKLYVPGKPCPSVMFSADFPEGRQALHAESLTIKLPRGEEKTFEAPIPDDFKKLLEELRSL